MVSKQALEQITNAPWQRELLNAAVEFDGAGLTKEYPTVLSDYIFATGQSELFPWVRLHLHVGVLQAADILYYYVVKQKQTDAVPDMTSGDVLEALQKEKKIFKHGILATRVQNDPNDYIWAKVPEIELNYVKLLDGEELRLLILGIRGQGTDGYVVVVGELDYRQTPQGA